MRNFIYRLLRKSEKYTKTDMVYLAKGGFWLSFGQIISAVAGLLLAWVYANYLPIETYGIYKYILSLVGILSIPTLAGINTSLMQAIANNYNGSLVPSLIAKMKWGLLGSVASLSMAIYYFVNGQLTLTYSFLIVAIFLPLMDPLSIYNSYIGGKKLFKLSTQYSIIAKIFSTVALIAAAFFTDNLFLIIFTYFISNTITRYIFIRLTLKKFVFENYSDAKIISYGKHLTVMNILATITGQLDKILVFHYLGAADLAIYSFAILVPEQIKLVFKNLNALAFPKFATKTREEIKRTLFSKIKKLTLLSACGTAIYIIIAPYVYKIFFPQYVSSIFLSQIFAISLVLMPMGLLLTVLESQRAQKELYKFNIYSPVAQIFILFFCIYFFGLIGLVMARIGIRLINNIISYFLVRNFEDSPTKSTV